MLALLLAVLPCSPDAPVDVRPALARAALVAPRPADDRPLRALEAWLKLYRAGKIPFLSKDNIARDSVALKFGVAKNGLGHPTWAGDLAAILEACVALNTPAAAAAVLEVAAIGIDQGKYTTEMAPYEVRATGEKWAAKFVGKAAREEIGKAARGELKTERGRMVALQTAGVRCTGLLADRDLRPSLELALGSTEEIVRISAAEALGTLGDEAGALALIGALERDTADGVLVAAANSLRTIYEKHVSKQASASAAPAPAGGDAGGAGAEAGTAKPAAPPQLPESVRLAVRAAIGALGRATWRADMALVRVLDDFRSQEAVPALIGVLERFRANPEDVKSGKLSGLLLYQVHELLVSMTGAVFPADQTEKWRELWEREKDTIDVARKPPSAGAGNTVAGAFFGIPVAGTRVVFVLDLSGSMDFDMDEIGADGKKKLSKRLDFAKRELQRAADQLSPNSQFNLITFNGNPKADAWEKDLVPATDKNRARFKKYVDGLDADGGTNLWAGLEEALKIKSLVYGSRYATNIDELFIVSDGAPSVGAVQDSVEILRLVQECNKFANVRINTIFISSQAPDEVRRAEARLSLKPQELMRRMAEQNGGKFREL